MKLTCFINDLSARLRPVALSTSLFPLGIVNVFLQLGRGCFAGDDAPFEGELAKEARDGPSTAKEMVCPSMVRDMTFSAIFP